MVADPLIPTVTCGNKPAVPDMPEAGIINLCTAGSENFYFYFLYLKLEIASFFQNCIFLSFEVENFVSNSSFK